MPEDRAFDEIDKSTCLMELTWKWGRIDTSKIRTQVVYKMASAKERNGAGQ